jgi:outer membrane lipoprotein-sorting protein
MDEVVARMKAQTEAVENYTLTTTDYVVYGRRTTEDGETSYQTVTRTTEGQPTQFFGAEMIGGLGATPDPDDLDRFLEAATYAGTETVGGRTAHVLRVDDPSALSEDGPPQEQQPLKQITLFIDAERDVPLRMALRVEQPTPQGPQTMNPTVTFSDYEPTDGLMVAHTTSIDMGLSPEMQQMMQQQMVQMRERMEQMPEAQRERMKQMPQYAQMQLMSSGDPVVVEVQDVAVNTDLDDSVFDAPSRMGGMGRGTGGN